MIEHPVPQNITAYQFHLIGNMTVKQFLMLLAGAGLGFLFYTTNLPGIIKWPLIFFFFALSAGAAFVPYEDRTLDQWIINFIRAIYRPTKYHWRRHPKVPEFLSYQPLSSTMQSSGPASWAPQKRQKVQAYLSSLQSANQTGEVDPLDIFTRPQADLNTLFTQVEAARNVTPGANQTPDKPSLQVRTRPLSQPQELFRATASAKTASGTPPAPAQHHRPAHTVSSVRQAKSTTGTMNTASLNSSAASVGRSAQALPTAQVKLAETQPIAHDSTPNLAGTAAPEQAYAEVESTSPTATNNQATQPAVFDRSLPFPSLPSEPNLLLGMVHDNQKKIIPNAIIEILDDKGTTVRAMKTNALGQFYISSALKPGLYHIETEKDGYHFPVYQITVNDTVLDPVNIQAK